MKLTKLFTTVLLGAAVVFAGCKAKTAKDLIVNKWRITGMEGKSLEGMPDSIRTKIYASATMEFKNDGKFITSDMGNGVKQGTYSVSSDGKTLFSTDEGATSTDTLNIMEITGNKMVIADRKSDVKITFGIK
jgi:hypothetical protein